MVTITHAKVSALADDLTAAAKGEVLPSDWNATHVITGSIASSLEIGATTVTSGTDNYALTVGGGTLGETPIRTILTADTTYHVATTGSDSTGDGSAGNPWATFQFAVDWIGQHVDASGRWITGIQFADGTYSGGVVGPESLCWILDIRGNAADNTKVIFQDTWSGAFDVVAIEGFCPNVVFRNITFNVTAGTAFNSGIDVVGDGCNVFVLNPYFNSTAAGSAYSCIYVSGANSSVVLGQDPIIQFRTPHSSSNVAGFFVKGTWVSCFNTFGAFSVTQERGIIGTFTFVSTPTFSQGFYTFSGAPGIIWVNPWTIVGSTTSPAYNFGGGDATSGSQLFGGSYPGNLATSSSASGCFINGFEFFDLKAGATPTTSDLFKETFGLFKDTTQPTGQGLQFWANDAGTIVTLTRQILVGNTGFFVDATLGSNSNPGTVLLPWATLQYAWDYVASRIDGQAFNVTINLAASATHYTITASSQPFNIGQLNILGAGSATTTIDDAAFLNVQTCTIQIDLVTLLDTGGGFPGGACLYSQATGTINVAYTGSPDVVLDGGTAAGYAYIYLFGTGVNMGINSITVKGNSGTAFFVDTACTLFGGGGNTVTVSGNPTFSGSFIQVDSGGQYSGGIAFSGAAVGPRFNVTTNGAINVNDAAGTHFPGNAIGKIASGGQYTGITDFVGIVASLPTANIQGTRAIVTDALAATFGSAPTGGHAVVVPVYNNGSAWIMG